jgi:hypothetical protein
MSYLFDIRFHGGSLDVEMNDLYSSLLSNGKFELFVASCFTVMKRASRIRSKNVRHERGPIQGYD